jgi:putrescine aminotransferase
LDGIFGLKIGDIELVTLEEAMASTRRQVVERFSRHVSPAEARIFKLLDSDKRYVKAEGIRVFDERGEEYLDFTACYGALCLGHNPPDVLEAVQKAASLPTVASFFLGANPLAGALAENLHTILPGHPDISSFGSGGAEAVEIALKTARASTGKKRLIYAEGSYHGLSLGSLSVSAGTYKKYFEPLLPNCEIVPFGDLQALETKLREGDVAAFIVEPVQAEAGCRVPPKGYLSGVRELCDRYSTLLILDEIQTGFGRTGKMFAAEHDGVKPDIVVISKALSAGVMPISASATSSEIWNKAYATGDRMSSLISTYRGNPKSCAAALKTIEILVRDGLAEHARKMGEYALQRLQDLKTRHKYVKEVRGLGLLLAIEFPDDKISGYVLSRMLNRNHIILGTCDHRPDVLHFNPPLNVQEEQIDRAIEALDETCSKSSVGLALGAGMTALERAVHV